MKTNFCFLVNTKLIQQEKNTLNIWSCVCSLSLFYIDIYSEISSRYLQNKMPVKCAYDQITLLFMTTRENKITSSTNVGGITTSNFVISVASSTIISHQAKMRPNFWGWIVTSTCSHFPSNSASVAAATKISPRTPISRNYKDTYNHNRIE